MTCEALAHDVRNRRLLLALYALGTNAALKRAAAGVADGNDRAMASPPPNNPKRK